MLFPTGSIVAPAWKPVIWLSVFSIVTGLISGDPGIRLGTIQLNFSDPITNFLAGSGASIAPIVQGVSQICLILTGIFAATSLVIRLRHARGEERQQIKWFVYASVWLVFFIVVSTLASFLALNPSAPYPIGVFMGIPNALTLTALPIATAMAILKHRLWDIDVIIRRTLIYAALTGILALIYFACVIGLQQIFSGLIGSGSTLAVVISTLTIAFLFNPLRLRVQSTIDRRFYRHRYNLEQTVSDFSDRVRDEVDLDQLKNHLVEVVKETMQPDFITLWLSPQSKIFPKDN